MIQEPEHATEHAGPGMVVTLSRDAVPELLMRAYVCASQGQSVAARRHLTDTCVRQVRGQADTDALIVLGRTQRLLGDLRAAAECYEQAAQKRPHAVVLAELAGLYRDAGRFFPALQCCDQALSLQAEWPDVEALRASCLMKTGQLHTGLEAMRVLVQRGQGSAELHSQYLFHLHYLPETDARTLLREYRRWGELFAPRHWARPRHGNAPDPDRRLRIGYVSADFRRHSVAYTFEAFLDGRDPQAVEVYGYGSVARPDEVTERLVRKFDGYRDIVKLDDKAAADLIARDRIDVLVALAGHTTGHRLRVLAYKPAPVQVDSGSLATTGMAQVDYRLTDQWLDPPGTQGDYLEECVYLPGGFVCYRPAEDAPGVAALPALKHGYLTFGSFNNLLKVNDFTVGLWARVLRAVPNSRLHMKFRGSHDPALRQRLKRCFEQNGVAAERLQILGYCRTPADHLQCFHTVDIALDCFPFNACVTALEGLWMGVPILTLNGTPYVAQVGRAIMTQLGLELFVAGNPDEFVAKALALHGQLPLLAKLRASLRQRMLASPLCDPQRYARDLQAAYRGMWRKWCAKQRRAQATLAERSS